MLRSSVDDGAGLADVAKRAALPFELVHPPREPIAEHRDRVALRLAVARVRCRQTAR